MGVAPTQDGIMISVTSPMALYGRVQPLVQLCLFDGIVENQYVYPILVRKVGHTLFIADI